MKTKFFYKQADDMVFEREINEWLAANPDIEIIHVGQSHAFAAEEDGRHEYEFIISIWYTGSATTEEAELDWEDYEPPELPPQKS